MPWLRFSSLVRSVMSVCSSAKPGDRQAAVSASQTQAPAEKAKARGPVWSPLATFTDFLSYLRFHLLHLQQRLLPVALGAAALGAEDKQGCGHWTGGQALKTLRKVCVGTCCVQGPRLEGQCCLLASAPPPLGRVWPGAPVLPSLVG